MSEVALNNIRKAKAWLHDDVFPIWSQAGVDSIHGGFVESLLFTGEISNSPRRAMVQSRQIYSFLTGSRLGVIAKKTSEDIALAGLSYMISKFSLPTGAFRYSIEISGVPKSNTPDLYTQAFALFGLAQGYSISKDSIYKSRALELVNYLKNSRAVAGGGFTEIDDQGAVSYKSNPHMHLFEAAIAWMEVDSDLIWKRLAHEISELCITKFIHSQTGLLAEYFNESWEPLKENGRFIYEPGHQYEWAWLLYQYQKLTQKNTYETRHQLFLLAEKHGTDSHRKIAFDEVWSDFSPKKISSRFWPQCERIKAAVRLMTEVSKDQKPLYAQAADEALETLFKFFETPKKGMWYDQISEADTFSGDSSKSSSLYHIINAIEEYVLLRL